MKCRTIAAMSIAVAIVLLCSFSSITSAQNVSDTVAAIYQSAASVPTNIPGVYRFPAPPEGFDVLAASDEERASYGFPPRPDAQADPHAYATWTRAMKAARIRWTGDLKDTGAYSMPGKEAPSTSGAASATSATPGTVNFFNWSGVANTNKLTKWNKSTSFSFVTADFNVPAAQQPFGACDGGIDWEVSWAGIDGFANGDVLQGGSSSEASCKGSSKSTSYCAWVEWFPSYGILCEFSVNPGDDMFVEVMDTAGGTAPGTVFVEDLTTQVSASVSLTYLSGPPLIGSSAEYIVERPCCRTFGSTSQYYPLANYVQDFWALSAASDVHGTQFYPGSTVPTTVLISMVDDGDTQFISSADAGTTGTEGKYGIFFQDENCALSGGCTP